MKSIIKSFTIAYFRDINYYSVKPGMGGIAYLDVHWNEGLIGNLDGFGCRMGRVIPYTKNGPITGIPLHEVKQVDFVITTRIFN